MDAEDASGELATVSAAAVAADVGDTAVSASTSFDEMLFFSAAEMTGGCVVGGIGRYAGTGSIGEPAREFTTDIEMYLGGVGMIRFGGVDSACISSDEGFTVCCFTGSSLCFGFDSICFAMNSSIPAGMDALLSFLARLITFFSILCSISVSSIAAASIAS